MPAALSGPEAAPQIRWPAPSAGPARRVERGLRAGNAGRPAAGARYVRAGLRQLGWAEDGDQPDARQVHEAHHALAARLLMSLAALGVRAGPHRVRAAPAGPRRAAWPRRMTGASCCSSAACCSCGPGGKARRCRLLDEAVALLEGSGGDREPGRGPAQPQLRAPQRRVMSGGRAPT